MGYKFLAMYSCGDYKEAALNLFEAYEELHAELEATKITQKSMFTLVKIMRIQMKSLQRELIDFCKDFL